jgi:hypothetical protein
MSGVAPGAVVDCSAWVAVAGVFVVFLFDFLSCVVVAGAWFVAGSCFGGGASDFGAGAGAGLVAAGCSFFGAFLDGACDWSGLGS